MEHGRTGEMPANIQLNQMNSDGGEYLSISFNTATDSMNISANNVAEMSNAEVLLDEIKTEFLAIKAEIAETVINEEEVEPETEEPAV